jgi:hypothetical protein
MEHRRNDTERGKPMYSEKNLFQCHFVHHKPHTESPGSNLALQPTSAHNHLNYDTVPFGVAKLITLKIMIFQVVLTYSVADMY